MYVCIYSGKQYNHMVYTQITAVVNTVKNVLTAKGGHDETYPSIYIYIYIYIFIYTYICVCVCMNISHKMHGAICLIRLCYKNKN